MPKGCFVAKVDIGGEIIPIVTNDHNVKVGDKVPVALHNANLANGFAYYQR